MDAGALVVLVLLSSSPDDAKFASTLNETIAAASRKSARIETEPDIDSLPDFVVRIRWTDAEHVAVEVHARNGRVVSQAETIDDTSQPSLERARALGYFAAAMLPESIDTKQVGVIPVFYATPNEEPAPRLAPPAPAPAPPLRDHDRASPPPASPTSHRFAGGIDGGFAVGRAVSSAGARAIVEWRPTRALGFRASGERRWFYGPRVDADEIGFALGMVGRLAEVGPVTFTVGADALAIRDDAAIANLNAPSTSHTSWTPGVAMTAGVEVALTDALALVAGPRGEYAPRQLGSPSSSLWLGIDSGIRLSF